MNTKTLLTIKTDKTLKDLAQKTAEEIGIPLGTIVNALIKQFVRNREVTLSCEHNPSKYLISAIKDAEKEYRTGKANNVFDDKTFIEHLRKL